MTPLRRAPVAGLRPALVALALAAPAAAQGGPDDGPVVELLDAARRSDVWLEVRPRFERVDDDGFARRADAATLRTAFGLRTAPWRGLSFVAEVENTTVLGSERFDDGLNGQVDRPLVLDPQGTTLNLVHAAFEDASGLAVEAGRVRYRLHDGRLVGEDPWRQNDQVFDGAVLRTPLLEAFRLEAAHFAAVNRPSGDEADDGRVDAAVSLLDLTFAPGPELALSAYLVDADLDDPLGQDLTWLGARAAGELDLSLRTRGRYLVDLARQRGEDGTGRDARASYAALRAELEWRGLFAAAGVERLGAGDGPGSAPLSTPLASLNDFNGHLDRFAVTPDAGLLDRTLAAGYRGDGLELVATWHDFDADRGGADLGRELDVDLVWRPRDHVALGLRLAHYRADGFGQDATSLSLWVGLSTSPARW